MQYVECCCVSRGQPDHQGRLMLTGQVFLLNMILVSALGLLISDLGHLSLSRKMTVFLEFQKWGIAVNPAVQTYCFGASIVQAGYYRQMVMTMCKMSILGISQFEGLVGRMIRYASCKA